MCECVLVSILNMVKVDDYISGLLSHAPVTSLSPAAFCRSRGRYEVTLVKICSTLRPIASAC